MTDSSGLYPPAPASYKSSTVVTPKWKMAELLRGALQSRKDSELIDLLKQAYNVEYCLLLDRARTGIYLLLQAMEFKREWLVTSFMHRPTAVLLKNNIDKLVFTDIDDDFSMQIESLEKSIGRDTQVIMATHMYGKTANIEKIRQIATEKSIFLVENCTHMVGGIDVGGKMIGSWGDASVLSFNVDKPVGGILGGALLTNSKEVWERISRLSLGNNELDVVLDRIYSTFIGYRIKPMIMRLPFTGKYRRPVDGIKDIESFPIDSYTSYTPRGIHKLQIAIAMKGIQRFDSYLRQRIESAQYLSEQLSSVSSLILPTSSKSQPHTYLYYPIILNGLDRFEVARLLANKGIETKWRYYPLHLQQGFLDCQFAKLPNTERIWANYLLLPLSGSNKTLHYMADSLKKVCDDASRLQH